MTKTTDETILEKLLKLRIHEEASINAHHRVMRVIGGWIYTNRLADSGVFVPHNLNTSDLEWELEILKEKMLIDNINKGGN